MSLWQRVQQLLGGQPRTDRPRTSAPVAPPAMADDEPETVVPEVTVDGLRAALSGDAPPLMIDIREPYEWRMVRMAGALHIPMNTIPDQLAALPHDHPIVVICAHGSRSYSVAAWLIEQGFDAASLAGGITQWAQQGGAVEQGEP